MRVAHASVANAENGLFSVQVSDDGGGIQEGDLGLLCARHATSKLRQAEDLRRIGTFGFRGEALASCAQVARVEVVTRTRASETAWRAQYVLGQMQGSATRSAGNVGTTIHVRDLFYGQRVRREALQASSDEYQRILQVVQAYAMDRAGRCGFVLMRRGREKADFTSHAGEGDERLEATLRVIRSLSNLPGALGQALVPVERASQPQLFGVCTQTTFHGLKQAQFTLFLNGRLIDHAVLKRACLQAYHQHLPAYAGPFVFLSLWLPMERVDVNVHPSKRQVFFLDEDAVVEGVLGELRGRVLQCPMRSQTFTPAVVERVRTQSAKGAQGKISALYPSQRQLVDPGNHRIDTFLYHSQLQARQSSQDSQDRQMVAVAGGSATAVPVSVEPAQTGPVSVEPMSVEPMSVEPISVEPISVEPSSVEIEAPVDNETRAASSRTVRAPQQKCDMAAAPSTWSRISLRRQVVPQKRAFDATEEQPQPSGDEARGRMQEAWEAFRGEGHGQMGELLRGSVVVGLVDERQCLLQSGTSLLLGDTGHLVREMFVSLLLQPPHLGSMVLARPVTLASALRACGDVGGEEEGALVEGECRRLLREQDGRVFQQLGIGFDESYGELRALPQLVPGQLVPEDAETEGLLRTFVLRLCLVPDYYGGGTGVLGSVAEELGALLGMLVPRDEAWGEYVRHVFLAQLRDARLSFRMRRAGDAGDTGPAPLLVITNTATLYRSFERC